jgi:hypothetical protein
MDIKTFFSHLTVRGRTVRTWLQAMAAILTFVYGLLSIPGVEHYLVANNIIAMGTLATVIAVVCYLYNRIEQLIKWLLSTGN